MKHYPQLIEAQRQIDEERRAIMIRGAIAGIRREDWAIPEDVIFSVPVNSESSIKADSDPKLTSRIREAITKYFQKSAMERELANGSLSDKREALSQQVTKFKDLFGNSLDALINRVSRYSGNLEEDMFSFVMVSDKTQKDFRQAAIDLKESLRPMWSGTPFGKGTLGNFEQAASALMQVGLNLLHVDAYDVDMEEKGFRKPHELILDEKVWMDSGLQSLINFRQEVETISRYARLVLEAQNEVSIRGESVRTRSKNRSVVPLKGF